VRKTIFKISFQVILTFDLSTSNLLSQSMSPQPLKSACL